MILESKSNQHPCKNNIFISDVEREEYESFAFIFPSRGANTGSMSRAWGFIIIKNLL